MGDGADALARRIVPADRPERVAPVLAAFRQHYRRQLLSTTRPYDGMETVVAELGRRRIPLAVLSNKPTS